MNNVELILCDFQTIGPEYSVDQKLVNDYTAWLMSISACAQNKISQKAEKDQVYESIQNRVDQYAVSSEIIAKRNILPVAAMLNSAKEDKSKINLPSLYENILTVPQGSDISARTHYFDEIVVGFFNKIYSTKPIHPEEIIHVTSMACIIPNSLQRFLNERGWYTTTVTTSYFVGCHGSAQALRIATGSLLNTLNHITKDKNYVDLIHTELLTIHIDTLDVTANNIISSTLFSDGFAKYSMYIQNKHQPIKNGLKLLHIKEQLIKNSAHAMRWEPGPYQFHLYLSKKIPFIIGQHLLEFIDDFCASVNINWEKEKDNLVFAIHPGGSKILDIVKEKLNLHEEQMLLSRKLLLENGNVSSATLPYLWKEIIETPDIKSGTKVLSLTFGPGITVAGILLEKI
jgi:alkylresorcinol/alkylpyrone synthase